MQALWPLACEVYFPARLRITSDLTRRQYFFAVESLAAMLDREPRVSDLTDANLLALIRWLQSRRLAAKTVNERVGRLKTLASWLWRKGYLPHGPTVERIPEPQRQPRAWNEEQLRSLFAAARLMPGRVGPHLASIWWFGLLGAAWWTGERTMALLSLRWEWLEGNVLYVPAECRKGGIKDAVYRLPPECLALLVPLSGSPLVFAWHLSLCSFYLHYDKLLRLAGLPTGRYHKLQKVRRSHATWLRIIGGDATRSLMHDDPATTQRYYIDRGLSGDGPVLFRPWQ